MSLPPPPAGLNLNETRLPRFLGATTSCLFLAIIAVALRLISRRMLRIRIWWDDWLIILSLLISAVKWFWDVTYLAYVGFGRHVWALPRTAWRAILINVFVIEILYALALSFLKISVLLFYWRIFGKKIKLELYVLGAFVCTWAIAVIFTSIFQCSPPSALWDVSGDVPFHRGDVCRVDEYHFFVGISIPNMIMDIAIVVLPLRFVWKLQVSYMRKWALTGLFVLVSLIAAVAITRFAFVVTLDLKSKDFTWNLVDADMWTSVEAYIGIVGACLPALGPFYQRAYTRFFVGKWRQELNSNEQQASTTFEFDASRTRAFHLGRHHSGSSADPSGTAANLEYHMAVVSAARVAKAEDCKYDPNTIHVRTQVDVEVEQYESALGLVDKRPRRNAC